MAKSAGKYFTDTALGNHFLGSTAAAGVAVPISTGTALTIGVWNTSTTKNCVPTFIGVGYTSGTIAIGEFGIVNQYVGFNVATAAPMAAITLGTPKNALLGSGKSSTMSFFPATATLTTGGTACYWLGCSNEIATAAPGVSVCYHDFDGKLIATPGQVIAVCGSVAQTGLFTITLGWVEVDV